MIPEYHKKGGRIIPTRMGTSCPCVRAGCARRDHPHAYGDKHAEVNQKFGSKGPTRMGTSIRLLSPAFLSLDHPHAYGDKLSDKRNRAT